MSVPFLSLCRLTGCIGIALFCTLPSRGAYADVVSERDSLVAARNVSLLFREEMQRAVVNLKWRGERLSEDTVYTAALTGLSWQTAWGKERLFWLGWGDLRKVPTLRKRNRDEYQALVGTIKEQFRAHGYREAVQTARANFTADEIACDPHLKEVVGYSLIQMGRPDQAYEIFASPFEVPKGEDAAGIDYRFRKAAFLAAQKATRGKEEENSLYEKAAIAFALSLLLEPGNDNAPIDAAALEYLERTGVEIDRVLMGILQAPEKLRGLPGYYYAASDLLVARARPRLLPMLMHLAQSDDVYLRGRAVIGLGILSFRARPGDPRGWASSLVVTPLREYGLSAGERKMIAQEVREAMQSDHYRLRTAAALALALSGEDESVVPLQKLLKDRAYILSPEEKGRGAKRTRTIQFPVRMAAAAGLSRFGISVNPGGGEVMGKQLDMARRGGQDVTNDHRNLRKDSASHLTISPLDMALADLRR